MIKVHETISLLGFSLFTKISMETPMMDAVPLPSDACYTYIMKGEGQIFSESENIVASTGQVILSLCGLTLGQMLSNQPKGSIDSIIVHFNRELLKRVYEGAKPELWEELDTHVTHYVVQSAADALVKSYFNGIIHLFDNRAALTDNILKLKLKEIILLLLQTNNSSNVREIVKSLFSERTFSFKEMVDAHIESAASIENLAMVTNCSISTFKRKFQEVYKTTPGKYLMEKKLDKVAESLRLSDESISQIGYQLGFDSPEHLSRSFKKKFGITPSNYRLNFSVK